MASAYSDAQIEQYCKLVQLPAQYHKSSQPSLNLELLNALHVCQITTVPYENLFLHYSHTATPSLDPQVLFDKFQNRGRGGYCLENSTFFLHILLAYGFDAYPVGVRVRWRTDGVPRGDYPGMLHIVIIVTLSNKKRYMIDVGFGGDGATKPLELLHGVAVSNIGEQEIRLVYDNIPAQLRKDKKLWIYEYRNGTDMPWNSFFAFSDALEFTAADFEIPNYFASTNSFLQTTVLLVKFLRSRDEMEAYGKVMMVNGVVKQNLGGKTVVVKDCRTEQERIEALREYFGIELLDEEREAIRGRVSQLPWS